MKISIITVFPELYEKFFTTSIIAKACKNNLIEFNLTRLSDMCKPKERIDEPTCGHGPGMIIKPHVIEHAIDTCQKNHGPGLKIFFSPQGKKINQKTLQIFADIFSSNRKTTNNAIQKITSNKLLPKYISHKNNHKQKFCNLNHLILICSRYEGIDARVEEYYADAILSIGDYILMGGDLPAQVFLEGLLRCIPNIIGKQDSVEKESFSSSFLDYPEYGLPKQWKNMDIPEIILSGNHKAIDEWRKKQAFKKTIVERFDWFRKSNPSEKDIQYCKKIIPPHYVALMHTDIILKGGRIGCSSITSLDLHDISRSSATYGIENVFMVTPLKDQQAIINELLDFWKSEIGQKYNKSRHEAVSKVIPISELDKVIDFIQKKEQKKPLVITTSAKKHNHAKTIDYYSQGTIWNKNKPVLFVFGTGQGLCDKIIDKSDFLLTPINGITNYNHLSVRSAVAITLDRWFGLNPKKET